MDDSLSYQARRALDYLTDAWPIILSLAKTISRTWPSSVEKIILCGCGDSHHAALGVEFLFNRWGKAHTRSATALNAARYLLLDQNVRPARTLVVAISASGEVARTLEAVEIAASRGGHTLALTSTEGSSLAEASAHALVLPTVEYPHGPGLLSYLGSLMGCIALAVELFDLPEIASALEILPRQLARWTDEQRLLGASMAEGENESGIVFAGGGPGYAAALFAAAKVVEAAGEYAWGQDLEEWAHLEYFCNPPEMATWFLDSGGRCQSRVQEVEAAAKAIGRRMIVSRWLGAPSWSGDLREALSPLALWPGPVAYAEKRRELLGERPFRGFTGGRSREEGGGASRIRTSRRLTAENLKN